MPVWRGLQEFAWETDVMAHLVVRRNISGASVRATELCRRLLRLCTILRGRCSIAQVSYCGRDGKQAWLSTAPVSAYQVFAERRPGTFDADHVYVCDIYGARLHLSRAHYAPDMHEAARMAARELGVDGILVTMGAGSLLLVIGSDAWMKWEHRSRERPVKQPRASVVLCASAAREASFYARGFF